MYWESVSNLVEPGGLVVSTSLCKLSETPILYRCPLELKLNACVCLKVVTSCNHTKDELLQEVEDFSAQKFAKEDVGRGAGGVHQIFRYVDHVQTYPTIMFGGVEGSQVCTVAFQRA